MVVDERRERQKQLRHGDRYSTKGKLERVLVVGEEEAKKLRDKFRKKYPHMKREFWSDGNQTGCN